MNLAYQIASITGVVLTAALLVLNALAPMTKSDKDDKLIKVLTFIHDKILAVLLPFLASQLANQNNPDKENK